MTDYDRLFRELLGFGDLADLTNWLDQHATMEDTE
jgi:hypothetical protein